MDSTPQLSPVRTRKPTPVPSHVASAWNAAPAGSPSPRRAPAHRHTQRPAVPPLPVARIDTSGKFAGVMQPMSFLSASSSSSSDSEPPASRTRIRTRTATSPASSVASSAFVRTPGSQDSGQIAAAATSLRNARWQARVDAELRESTRKLKENIRAARREMAETRRVLDERRRRVLHGAAITSSPTDMSLAPSDSGDSYYSNVTASSRVTPSSSIATESSGFSYHSASASDSTTYS
ncbi:hypothetical protein EXIGLDRAFT_729504, partial [Exidia glandulosa HHB12029]